MKKILVFSVLVSQVLFSYSVDFTDYEGVTSGHCDNGDFLTASKGNDGWYYATANGRTESARSIGNAMKKACGE